jgi:predicted RNase H-like HicB family nuclease
MYYQVPLKISKQEDGLWRVEATCLQGCWVDAPTLEQALAEIHEVIAMVLDLYQEQDWSLPKEVVTTDTLPLHASIPVAPGETKFRRVSKLTVTQNRRQ